MASPHRPLGSSLASWIAPAVFLSIVGSPPAQAQCPPGRVFGAHAPYAVGAGPNAIVLEDLNEDGVLDLVVSNGAASGTGPGAGMITVRLGQGGGGIGDGSFGPGVFYAAGVQLMGLVSGDFDEDGILDVAAGDYLGAQVVVLMGKGDAGVGDGTFAAPQSFAPGTRPRSIASGDFDEDGITDLVIGDDSGAMHGHVAILRGLGMNGVGDGGFASPQFYFAGDGIVGLAVGDFDEDGIFDLAATTETPMGVSILRGGGVAGAGNGTFLPATTYAMTLTPYSIVAGDFDEDGIMDLATANHSLSGDGGSVRVLRGRGSDGVGDGTFDPEASYPASRDASSIVSGDWDADGILDLAVANSIVDSITVLLGQGIDDGGDGTFGEPTSHRAAATPMDLATADLNADGRLDLVVAEYSSNEARVFLGACAPHTGLGPRIVAVRDAPADQGGAVFVAWERSPYDGDTGNLVRGYTVSRRVTPESPWETLATLPAQRLFGYGFRAPTTRDSTPLDNPFTAFRVTATTADSEMVFASTIDSGYSIDNLAPPSPESFVAVYGAGVALRWAAASVPDHATYRLHRAESELFVLSPANLLAELTATEYVDASGTVASRYRLVAVDRHGNESAPALATPTLGEPPRLALAITRLAPNPAQGGRVSVAFTLPDDASALLEVFDSRGRIVYTRPITGAGEGAVVVPGERGTLAAGVYVIRLTQSGRSVRAKSVVLR